MYRAALSAAFLCAAAAPASAYRIERIFGVLSDGRAMEVIAEQALVRFSTAMPASQRQAVLASVGSKVINELDDIGWTLVDLASGTRVQSGIESLRTLPGVENVQPNHFYTPNRTTSDPRVPFQYALSQINAFAAWDYEVGLSCRVTVAVIDSGVQVRNADLTTNLELSTTTGKVLSTQSRSFNPDTGAVSAGDPLNPICSHGTRVAGIAAASTDNNVGIAGISWGAKVLALRVFDGSSQLSCGGTSDAALAAALNYAITLQNTAAVGKIVVNMSIGGVGSCATTNPPCPGVDCFSVTKTALANATAAGIPVVISAGNDGGAVNVPANCAGTAASNGIIPVGATDSSNNVAAFSSRGAEMSANGVVAPGVSVETTDFNSNTSGATGTSFAAPLVAGLAALILAAKPTLSAAEVQAIIRGGAENIGVAGFEPAGLGGRGEASGAGRLNAFRSMRLAVRGTLADFDGDKEAIAFPNPFRPAKAGTVTFSVPVTLQGSKTQIRVYTVGGQFVRELSGVSWDGKNLEGVPVASGTYIFLVNTSAGRTSGRVTLIR